MKTRKLAAVGALVVAGLVLLSPMAHWFARWAYSGSQLALMVLAVALIVVCIYLLVKRKNNE